MTDPAASITEPDARSDAVASTAGTPVGPVNVAAETGTGPVDGAVKATLRTLVPLIALILVPAWLISVAGSAQMVSATTSALITMVMVVGLYLFCGNSGVLAFGHAAFVAVGAYTCGILTIPTIAKPAILPNLPATLANHSVSPTWGIAAGGLVAGLVAAVAFLPLRRLNAQALSIVTLALLLIAHVFFTSVRLSSSGGAITRVPIVATIGNVLPWLLAVVVVALVFQHSRLGLRLRASREDEFAAEAGGIDIGWTRYAAFVVSATCMGIGGGLYAVSLGSFSSDDFFLSRTILLFTMMVVGGLRSLTGAVVGTALISAISYFFGQLESGLEAGNMIYTLPTGTTNLSIALCMILVLMFRRDGLLSDHEIRLPRLRGRASRASQAAAVQPDTRPDSQPGAHVDVLGNEAATTTSTTAAPTLPRSKHMDVRRVVTGLNTEGRARVISDGPVDPKSAPSLPGAGMHYVWGADVREVVPTDGTQPAWHEHFPPTDGYRVIVFTMPPGQLAGREEPMTPEELAEAEANFPGLHSTFDEEDAGMHASVTVDVGVILHGLVDLEVDDGNVTHLKAGDVVIQNGTRHKWSNGGDTEAAIAFILMGRTGEV